MNVSRPALETLVGSNGGFLDSFYPYKPFVHHGPVARFAEILDCAQLADARATIFATTPPILAFENNGYQAILPDANEAMERYETGDCSLYLPTLHSISVVRSFAERLASDLGIHPSWIYCEGFLARDGRNVGLHYDFDLNFNIQLRGTKVWHIARNTHVENPLATYVAGSRSTTPAPNFARAPMPNTMPRSAQRIVLRPGSVIFLPRGYWHQTENQGESFALSFAIKPPTWSALVLSELGRRLERESRWRAHAFTPEKSDASPGAIDLQLKVLLDELAATISGMIPAEVLAAHRAAMGPVRFRWITGTNRKLTKRETGWVLVCDRDGVSQGAELDDELAPLMEWLVASPGQVTVGSGCDACPSLSPELVEQTLLQLVSAGMLQGE